MSEDRGGEGLQVNQAIDFNISLAALKHIRRGVFLDLKKEKAVNQKLIEKLQVKCESMKQKVTNLSGGNQQKVVIGRSLSTSPKLVILDEPTRGIDAGARGDVYSIIHQLRNQGVSVLLISSDMEEIVELSDRVMTVCQGRINGEFTGEDINQDNLMAASFGITKNTEVEA